METPLANRRFVRIAGGTDLVQLLTVSGITTVLAVRGFLYLTGYPQVGGSSLHIAHVLWGGLFMLAALVIALMFVGRGARKWTAVLGGIGLGLFVDEIGKFVTNTNDYFYRPAASIIYVVFALLVLATTLINRDKLDDRPERIVNASVIATDGLTSGLSPKARAQAEHMLEGRNESEADGVRALLRSIPDTEHSTLYNRFVQPILDRAERVAQRHRVTNICLITYAVTAIYFSYSYIDKSMDLLAGRDVAGVVERQAVYAIAAADTVSAAVSVIGAALLTFIRRRAFQLVQIAVLVNLLFGQVFNFTDNQFSAVVGLPLNLIALAIVTYELRVRGS